MTRTNIAFGTDGIRGVAGRWPIDEEGAVRVGAAAARWGGIGHGVVIGRDPRSSGFRLAEAVASGVRGSGGRPVDAGVVPTAAVQVALAEGLGRVGVMITASHNPDEDNGFKLLGVGGRKPDDETCGTLAAWMSEEPRSRATPPGEELVDGSVARVWLDALAQRCPDLSVLAGRRIAIDLGNGAASPHREALERWLPCQILWLGARGRVNDGCGTEHLEALREAVVSSGCDGGFALDGDADRCRLVDQHGAEVPGDAITWLLARTLDVSRLAVTVMSNGALEGLLPGVAVVRTPVGDRHLREVMDRDGIALGAEESGHVLFGDHPGGDGVLTGVRALCSSWRRARTVSEAVSTFVPWPRRTARVRVAARPPLDELHLLQDARRVGEAALGRAGRVHLRYSGTEPVLRILVEGRDRHVVDRVHDEVVAAARAALPGAS
ncbi:MAG: phosphoglucosamine mutase [Alphaproteobacteria bacterium]|nr:phosphoglucosamine mutase [Alphaproteobacteria bacterium]MCB9699490.1 phosphoglucosamine mutase [Alphaproteobacteria bacterium]